MDGISVAVLESLVRSRNRVLGVGWYRDPVRYFDDDGIEGAERRCLEANRDLLAFVRPPAPELPSGVEHRVLSRRAAGEVHDLRFDSPLPSGDPDNDRVELRVWLPAGRGGARRAVIFHHPLFQRRWALWDWFLAPFRAAAPVAALAAPYHFSRRPRGQHAGEGTVNPNPWNLFRAIRQWSWDEGAARAVLADRLGLEVKGVVGFSLGAFQSLLLASAGGLDLPIVSIASTNRYAFGIRHGALGGGLRDGFRRAGIGHDRFERMVDSIQLDRHVGRRVGRSVLFVYGRHDRVDPPPSTERLIAALRPRREVPLEAGHATVVFCRDLVARESIAFFEELGVIERRGTRAPRPPDARGGEAPAR